jgi:AraC-like DNA-binding protein
MLVSAMVIRGILAEFRRREIDSVHAAYLLAIDEERLVDFSSPVSCDEFHEIVERAVEALRDPGLGLTIGSHAPLHMFHLVSALILSARTVWDAFVILERHAALLADGTAWRLVEDGARIGLVQEWTGVAGRTARFASELAAAMIVRFASSLAASPSAYPVLVTFRHPEPDYLARYAAVFASPVEFDSVRDAVWFDRGALEDINPYGDAAMFRAFSELAERELHRSQRPPMSLEEQLRLLLQFDARALTLSMAELGLRLGLTERQMRRRLQHEQTSLSEVVEQARQDYACTELRHGRSIQTVADTLGFSERSAFHRAFKRWTGQTPQEFQKQYGPQGSR